MLLDKTIEVNESFDGMTLLQANCLKGRSDVVKFLIQEGANVSLPDSDSDLPIHLAAMQGHTDVVRLLIRSGSPCNLRNKNGVTSLHLAAYKGFVDIVRCLIENKADLNVQDVHGNTPLHVAIKKKRIEEAKLLIHHKASLEVCNQRGFHIVLWVVFHNGFEILKHILKTCSTGDLINAPREEDGVTALHLAARNGFKECCKILCEIPTIQVNCRNKTGQTPLHMAAIRSWDSIVDILLQHKDLDVDPQDATGDTPLMDAMRYACSRMSSGHDEMMTRRRSLHKRVKTHREIARCLVLCGANVNKTNKAGKSPLSACTDPELTSFLEAHAAKSNDTLQQQMDSEKMSKDQYDQNSKVSEVSPSSSSNEEYAKKILRRQD